MQHLGLVLVPRRGGAVGVQDQCPAAAVDHHLVVERAEEYAVLDRCRAAVGLVLDVVHFLVASAARTLGWVAARLAQAVCEAAAPRVIPVLCISQARAL